MLSQELGVLVMVALIAAIVIIPCLRLCARTGVSKGLALLLLVPVVGWMVFVWVVAFSRWKREPNA